jgi:hypothetical protein
MKVNWHKVEKGNVSMEHQSTAMVGKITITEDDGDQFLWVETADDTLKNLYNCLAFIFEKEEEE